MRRFAYGALLACAALFTAAPALAADVTGAPVAPGLVVAIPVEDVQLRRTIGVVTRRGVPPSDNAAGLLARIETALVARFHPHGADGADLQARPRD